LSEAFRQFDVPHALIGGLAVGLGGHPRATADIDLIVSAPALMVDRAETTDALGVPINVAGVEGLILCKLLADRGQDRADVEALAVANLDHIDRDFIDQEWKTVADVSDPRITAFHDMMDALKRERQES
jgi:hypothetical protein